MSPMVPEITVQEYAKLRAQNADVFLLDVRNKNEYDICNLNGCLIPLNQLESRFKELNPKQHIVVHCHHGGRSAQATKFLLAQGFNNVQNLVGGIHTWAKEIDTTMPTY